MVGIRVARDLTAEGTGNISSAGNNGPELAKVPFDAKAASMAAKLGKTFADANRSTKAGSAIRELAKVVSNAGDSAGDGDARAKPSLLGKFDLKAMMPGKTAKKAIVVSE